MRLDKPFYRLVDCKRCGAKIGKRCRGTVRNSHGERIVDALRLKVREAGRRAQRRQTDEEFLAGRVQHTVDTVGVLLARTNAAFLFVLDLARSWAAGGYQADDAATARAAYKLLEKHGVELPPEPYDENGVRR